MYCVAFTDFPFKTKFYTDYIQKYYCKLVGSYSIGSLEGTTTVSQTLVEVLTGAAERTVKNIRSSGKFLGPNLDWLAGATAASRVPESTGRAVIRRPSTIQTVPSRTCKSNGHQRGNWQVQPVG